VQQGKKSDVNEEARRGASTITFSHSAGASKKVQKKVRNDQSFELGCFLDGGPSEGEMTAGGPMKGRRRGDQTALRPQSRSMGSSRN